MRCFAQAGAAIIVAAALAGCSGSGPASNPVAPSATPTILANAESDGTNAVRGLASLVDVNVLSGSDRDFVDFITRANQAEIELGTLAEQRADLPEVKDFAKQMVQDHSVALAALRSIASNAVTSNITLDSSEQQLRTQLAQLSGSAFDRVYMAATVRDHQTTLARIRQASSSATPEVRDYARGILSSVLTHLSIARDIATRIGSICDDDGTATSSTSTGSGGVAGSGFDNNACTTTAGS